MQLKYGGYSFDVESVWVTTLSTEHRTKQGLPTSRTDQVDVAGYLQGSSQADLTAKILFLNQALATPFQDLILLDNAGNVSAVRLYNAGSTSGVRVLNGCAKYPSKEAAEYVTYRYFEFSVSANYPYVNAGTQQAVGPPFGGNTPPAGATGQSGTGSGWVEATGGVSQLETFATAGAVAIPAGTLNLASLIGPANTGGASGTVGPLAGGSVSVGTSQGLDGVLTNATLGTNPTGPGLIPGGSSGVIVPAHLRSG